MSLKLSVPFIYEAMIVDHGDLEPTMAVLRDSVEVELAEPVKDGGDLPVALVIEGDAILFDDERFWIPLPAFYESIANAPDLDQGETYQSLTDLSFERMRQTLAASEMGGYDDHKLLTPYTDFWKKLESECMHTRHGVPINGLALNLTDAIVTTREALTFSAWVDDNRAAVVAQANKIADRVRVYNGRVYIEMPELVFLVATPDIDVIEDEITVILAPHFASGQCGAGFNLMNHNAAIRYAEQAARKFDLDPTRDIVFDVSEITVYKPESFKAPPFVEIDPNNSDKGRYAALRKLEDFFCHNVALI